MARLRNVAVVAFSQAPVVARDEHRIASEILYPEVRSALDQCDVEREAIDYQVAGSADYVDGRPFGFVTALDVMGSWPPKQDLHLEMDAAFAAYYAWVRMQAGDCDTALVCGYGKNSEGEPERVLNLELDPYYQAPLGLGPSATAALQASAFMARTGATDRDLAQVAARNRAAGAKNPCARLREAVPAETLATTPWVVEPLRRGYLPPYGDSAVCLVLAAEGKAERMCDRPAWIHGVDQRIEMQTLGARDLSRSAGARLAAEKALAMAGRGRPRGAERAKSHRPRRAGPLLAAEPLLRAGPRAEVDVRRPVAVVGVGQTRHASRRSDVSIPGLVREAVDRALLDAGLDYADIDAVVMGKAPDQLEGVMQPEQFLAGAVGAHLKPLIRVHTAGSVGASTALAAVTHVASGLFDRVLTVAWEKQSEGNAMWALSPNLPFTPPLVAGAGGFFAPYCRAYMMRTGCPAHIGPMVAANARANGGRDEDAHLRRPVTGEDGGPSPPLS